MRQRANGSATISGIGAVTGYGWGRERLWEGAASGLPAGRLTPGFGAAFDHDEVWLSLVPDGGNVTDGRGRLGRAVTAAVREAVEDATDRGWRPGLVVGLVHAIVLGEVDLWRDFYLVHGMRRTRQQFTELMPSTPLATIMREHGFDGPCLSVTAMSASGNAGVLTAKQWLEVGMASDVVVVATDISATPDNVRSFVDVGVCVADRPPLDGCRPFQEGSGGFVVGEASVAMVMSSSPLGGYARVLGGAVTQDAAARDARHVIAHVQTYTHDPTYAQIRRCWTSALADARVDGAEVVYLNAHGPGTRECDAAEAALLDELLPAAAVYSFKPLIGHCQGAAAALEVAMTCLAYDRGWIPAPPQVATGHPRLVSGLVRRVTGPVAKSSMGMGGNHSLVILDEPRPA